MPSNTVSPVVLVMNYDCHEIEKALYTDFPFMNTKDLGCAQKKKKKNGAVECIAGFDDAMGNNFPPPDSRAVSHLFLDWFWRSRRFKSRIGQMRRNVATGTPPLRHVFERSGAARVQRRGLGSRRKLVMRFGIIQRGSKDLIMKKLSKIFFKHTNRF